MGLVYVAAHAPDAGENESAVGTVEIPGASHSVYESHSKEAASVIADAARSFEK